MKLFNSKKKILKISIGIVPYGEYIIHITKNFFYGTLYEFYNKDNKPLQGYELYVVGESFRCNCYKTISVT